MSAAKSCRSKRENCRDRRFPTVVPADSRPRLWPPIWTLPRNRLASSATGGDPHYFPRRISPAGHVGPALHKFPVGRHLCVPPSSAPLVMCHCEGAPRPWQSALPDNGLASGGSLSFCGERKGGKNAAKTNGFGILFADRIQQDPELSNHANLTLQNSHLAFASSLRLHPRRALRLCWPGGTGEASASAVGRREGTPPYGGLSVNGV